MLSRVRAAWRAARSAPVIGSALAAADRMWWARIIRRADIVDLDAVAAQAGRRMSERAAIRRYVRGGFREGFTLNPLYLERTISRQLSDSDRVPALYAYLVNDRRRLRVSPLWDAEALAKEDPAALDDPAGPLGHAWRRAQSTGTFRLAGTEIPRAAVTELAAHAFDRPAPLTGDALICVLGPDETDPDQPLRLVLDAVQRGLEVDIRAAAAAYDVFLHARLISATSPRVRVTDTAAVFPAPRATGATVFRGPHASVTAETLPVMLREAAHGPVAALWLAPDGTVAAAGAVRLDGRTAPLLRAHPLEDAQRLGSDPGVPALAGPVRAWPAGAAAVGAGHTLTSCTTTARFDAAWLDEPQADADGASLLARAGFRFLAWHGERAVVARTGTRRRWAIRTSAPAGAAGEAWGDTHFARDLAAALRRLGEDVVVDSYDARERETSYLDDVTVVLRGPHPIPRGPSGRSLLWIISHPDEITAEEVAGFDAVFAASTSWARRATSRFGTPVHPLLQCTDTTKFHPGTSDRGTDIVFVGTARGIARPVVVAPIRAGIPVKVYGPDWSGYIPAGAVVSPSVPRSELPELYRSAGVVLNDHWPAMQREGFVSNRLYDVVAAGGRAISDDVVGISETFGAAVRTYSDVEELLAMLSGDLDALFPDEAELGRIAHQVAAEHSFDARARTLVQTVDGLSA
ncbi:glycosyltransferase [Microbacterium sp. zg.Y625]|uniref:glycosyltransferase n=1 Tax=Microbacterium jiangjiandongii TaxID=3049071 RepID=UPI00214B0AE2|nr:MULTISPECIES: glycosyltransferase [unclassified Microbacterium]MCR2793755.1 glycosyltransferase [Microbacterium sp. zg.Y625]WIM26099.1 glycosyltransferase [Microbacterium sp. zg-Y625]